MKLIEFLQMLRTKKPPVTLHILDHNSCNYMYKDLQNQIETNKKIDSTPFKLFKNVDEGFYLQGNIRNNCSIVDNIDKMKSHIVETKVVNKDLQLLLSQ